MKIGKHLNGIRYTLSNDDLQVGDKVYPIGRGYVTKGEFILGELDFRDFMSGFPDEPHTILDLNYDNGRQGKAYQVRTDMGFSPIESYYKIIKKEKQVKPFEWVEIEENN